MIYLDLFLTYFKIGLFSIGGGHASLPLVQSIVVNEKNWLSMAEFSDIVTLSEMTPGPFGINSATYIGMKMGGVLGGVITTFSVMLAPFIIVMILAVLFTKFGKLRPVQGALMGVKPAVTGLISSAGISIILLAIVGTNDIAGNMTLNVTSLGIAIISYLILKRFKINIIVVIFIAGFLGGLIYMLPPIW